MEKSYIDIDKIERYIKGVSDDTEIDEVRSRLAMDEEFRMLFDDMEIMTEGLRRSGKNSTLEEKIENLDKLLGEEVSDPDDEPEEFTEKEIKPTIIVLWYKRPYLRAIAAGFALLIIAWFAIGPFSNVTEEELFADNFVPYTPLNNNTRGGNTASEIRDKANSAYENGNYSSAITFFEEMITNQKDQIADQFYLGNAYLAIGEGKKAVSTFTIVVEQSSGLKTLGKWYLGLSYLKIGDKENAEKVLTEVRDAGSDNAEKAGEILEKLKQ